VPRFDRPIVPTSDPGKALSNCCARSAGRPLAETERVDVGRPFSRPPAGLKGPRYDKRGVK